MRMWDYVRAVALRNRAVLVALAAFTGVILTGQGPDLLSLVASTTASFGNSRYAITYFAPHEEKLAVGGTATVDVKVNVNTPINAIGATIVFDPTALEVVGISKETSFLDLWTEETMIREKEGEIRFSGGTLRSGGLEGIETAVTLKVRAKKEGHTELSFKEAEVFAHDGKGSALLTEKRTLAFTIEPASVSTGVPAAPPEPQKPSADFNNDGRVTIADMSILAIQLLAGYNARYDLNLDGSVNLADLSVFFSEM